jgi:hypothetical protein
LEALDEISPSVHLLAIIDLADIWGPQSSEWDGTALELRALPFRNPRTQRDANRLLDWPNATGQYLGELACQHRVNRQAKTTLRNVILLTDDAVLSKTLDGINDKMF